MIVKVTMPNSDNDRAGAMMHNQDRSVMNQVAQGFFKEVLGGENIGFVDIDIVEGKLVILGKVEIQEW